MAGMIKKRRRMISIVGDGAAGADSRLYKIARECGRRLVDDGFRVCAGGLGGVMEGAFRGAHDAAKYREGDTVAILPTLNPAHACRWADIVIATGLNHLRNGIVANADALIVVGGAAGTLSEIAFAWKYNRLIVAITEAGGVGAKAAGRLLGRARYQNTTLDRVLPAQNPAEAVALVKKYLPAFTLPPKAFSAPRRK
jgi:uncharacterized protein (TIGR00725 family)